MAWIRIILFCIFIALISQGCVNVVKLADLRTENYTFPNDQSKAKALLKAMGDAHRIALWDSIESYEVIFEDEFYGFFGKRAHPFKEQKISLALRYIPKEFTGQLEILSGEEKGETWGIQSWTTYKIGESGKVLLEENKDMTFWIPTYQYFVEFPNRIQEASVVDYLGSSVINGVEVEGVIASWNTVEPQKEIDQYVVWLDAKTSRIVKLEYTVRDAYKFLTGAAYFTNYFEWKGMPFPSEMPVESNLVKKGLLHTMKIIEFSPETFSAESLKSLSN